MRVYGHLYLCMDPPMGVDNGIQVFLRPWLGLELGLTSGWLHWDFRPYPFCIARVVLGALAGKQPWGIPGHGSRGARSIILLFSPCPLLGIRSCGDMTIRALEQSRIMLLWKTTSPLRCKNWWSGLTNCSISLEDTGSKIHTRESEAETMAGQRLWYCHWKSTRPTIANSMREE